MPRSVDLTLTKTELLEAFPIGCEVTTDFYKDSRDKIRRVASIYNPGFMGGPRWFIQTECGINADHRWFRRVVG